MLKVRNNSSWCRIANCKIEITNLINKKIRIRIFNIDNINSDLLELDEVNKPVPNIIIKDADIENSNTLNLKLVSNDQNVGHKQSHVIVTFYLLNDIENTLKPENQYW
ncbi:15554_t:CDS:2 [Cetraspora pellucida]|uniref:15554_t:CDS:1 n=1 Tax=Cetraspora pellucida TaxID=1433469 RepID=A0A9N9HWA3_9GLOM|nr:15554_t:CDS:2 [Cetraspora pellucida]